MANISEVRLCHSNNSRSPVALHDPNHTASGQDLLRCFHGYFLRVHLLFVFLFRLCHTLSLNVIVLESDCCQQANLNLSLTILVKDFFTGRFPLRLRKQLHNNNIAVNRAVHSLAANQKDWFGHASDAHCAFKVVVLVRVEVALLESSTLDTSRQLLLREVLHVSS